MSRAPAATAPAGGRPLPHESAVLHVTGEAVYVDDLPELDGTLHAAPILSPVAHGRLIGVDTAAALACPGVVAIVLAGDIPGDPILATPAHDEPILARNTVEYAGQVIGLVIADSHRTARRAARLAVASIEPLPALLTIEQALAADSHVLPPVRLSRGDAKAAIAAAPHRIGGELRSGGQEHFYLEGQVAYAVPGEQRSWRIHSSTQHPGEVQHWIANALGVPAHAVTVECRRIGGGFGGKETQAGQVAVWAAIAAHRTGHPVKMRLDRDDDFMLTGKRHDFLARYEAGVDDDGRILGLRLTLAARCGFSADLSGPICDRAVFHADNCYWLPDVEIESLRLRTHTQSNTAFRGFGGPQGMLAIETIIGEVARHLGRDALDVRRANFYGTTTRNVTPYGMTIEDNIVEPLVDRLARDSRYRERRDALLRWNATSPLIKRGLALTPVKFGISFTATQLNQAGALVHVYTDGSVLVNHGGTEMGQGLHTKVLQLVADELGIPVDAVRASASDTSKIPNASATAASSGTDLNGRAAQFAARAIRTRLAVFAAARDGVREDSVEFRGGFARTAARTETFCALVQQAHEARVQLWSEGFYATPKIHYDRDTLTGRPFYYFVYGAACAEVAIDTLTGESRVLAVDILHDAGRSLNPAIDRGQIDGGFVQGMGWLTTEELIHDDRGGLATHAPSTYKIPTAGDVPEHLRVTLWDRPNREDNVFGSKAVGEPPLMLAISVLEALRDAVAACAGAHAPIHLDAPATPEAILRAVTRARARR